MNHDRSSSAGIAVPASPLELQLGTHEETQEHTVRLLLELDDRLASVLIPQPPKQPEAGGPINAVEPASSPMQTRVVGMSNRQRSINARIQSLLDALAI